MCCLFWLSRLCTGIPLFAAIFVFSSRCRMISLSSTCLSSVLMCRRLRATLRCNVPLSLRTRAQATKRPPPPMLLLCPETLPDRSDRPEAAEALRSASRRAPRTSPRAPKQLPKGQQSNCMSIFKCKSIAFKCRAIASQLLSNAMQLKFQLQDPIAALREPEMALREPERP